MFPKEDIITVKSWMDVGDCNYEHDHKKQGTIPDSGVVYCNIEHISEFFDRCKDTDNKYVVVSGFSDYGVAIQSEYPVCLDMFKFWPLLQNTVASLGYEDLKISARCDKNLCNINHKYSVRCNSFTHSTFDEIPDNVVKWFCCNACAKDEKIIPIPFGVNHSEETIEELSKIDDRIHFYSQDNKGVSEARNHGISKAKGEFIALLDADDYWLPENLEIKLRFLEKHNHARTKKNRLLHSFKRII